MMGGVKVMTIVLIKEQNFGFFSRNIAEILVIGGARNDIANR